LSANRRLCGRWRAIAITLTTPYEGALRRPSGIVVGVDAFFGLARLGYTDSKGLPFPLQLALCALEFSDVLVFRSPPVALQRTIFAALAPIARWRGYRATYPQLSRIVLASRT
jgi:hypothetical protein